MLYEYVFWALCIAVIFTLKAFDKNTEYVGKIFFFLTSGVFWIIAAYGSLNMTYKWAGDNAVISYSYLPDWEAHFLIWSFGGMGILMNLIGIFRAFLASKETVELQHIGGGPDG